MLWTLPIRLICFLLVLTSCHEATELNEKDKTQIIQEVEQTLDHYYQDIRANGLIAEFQYLDNSAEFFWVPPGYSGPITYDSVANILKQNAAQFKSVNNVFDTLQIVPLRKELASYTGRLHSVMTDTSGKVMKFYMVETGVLIKRKDGWKLLNGQTSILNR